jgi:hypothetical protein
LGDGEELSQTVTPSLGGFKGGQTLDEFEPLRFHLGDGGSIAATEVPEESQPLIHRSETRWILFNPVKASTQLRCGLIEVDQGPHDHLAGLFESWVFFEGRSKGAERSSWALVAFVECINPLTQKEPEILSGFKKVNLSKERFHLIIGVERTVVDLCDLMAKKAELSSHCGGIPAQVALFVLKATESASCRSKFCVVEARPKIKSCPH